MDFWPSDRVSLRPNLSRSGPAWQMNSFGDVAVKEDMFDPRDKLEGMSAKP